jgi:DNA-damage-inducible protein J
MTTTLSIRLDQNLKRDSQKVFKKLGMDISSATKIFLTQVVNTESIPFKIRTVNGFTPEFELGILEELKDIKDNPQNYKKYKSGKEIVSDILGKEK